MLTIIIRKYLKALYVKERIMDKIKYCAIIRNRYFSYYPSLCRCGRLRMFSFCSQLLVGIYKEIALQIESILSSALEEKMRFLLESHNQLVEAVNRVMDRFELIMIANTCLMALNLFYTLYYSIEFLHDGYWLHGFHHLLDFLIALFRLWLGCHSADRILKKVL